jgi:hypothetical protein
MQRSLSSFLLCFFYFLLLPLFVEQRPLPSLVALQPQDDISTLALSMRLLHIYSLVKVRFSRRSMANATLPLTTEE